MKIKKNSLKHKLCILLFKTISNLETDSQARNYWWDGGGLPCLFGILGNKYPNFRKCPVCVYVWAKFSLKMQF